ncbi:MAG: tRNA pseudouridine(38-40) synthase TruA [Proteobacteria bacterium]|nr:tRNA pseudouridine(38-40) synthase TruA [Pseudomonadota bacterium]
MRTIKLTISYDGTNYVGWQVQANGLSVQELIQRALSRMTGEGIAVIGASRTDAGVHALGQVAHFCTGSSIPLEGFARGINSLLPDDISIVSAEEAGESFHANRDAKGKIYLYRLLASCGGAPLAQGRCWQMREPLDLAGMREGAAALVGEHDFESFRAAGCAAEHSVRRIDRIDIDECASPDPIFASGDAASLVEFTFEGAGFLRHMIRNIVGTLVDVGRGRIEPQDVRRILGARKREQAGRCAPACGLYLVKVLY